MKRAGTILAMAIAAAAGPAAAGPVHLDPAETRKLCQVTGEYDRERQAPTVNRTETTAKFWGADLGASFEHEGRLVVLFGDTHPFGTIRPRDADSIAFSDTRDPADCLRLQFPLDGDGGYRPLTIPGIFQGAFAVPTGGFSRGGRMYVFASSDVPGRGFSARSVLARSDDHGLTFRALRTVSSDHMAHISPVVVRQGEVNGLPEHAGDGVLLFATGLFRGSKPYLAFAPADAIEDPTALRHFAGLDAADRPIWSDRETDGVPLFDQACLGEFSAGRERFLGKWLLLYTCGGGRATTYLRTADRPWGPWSMPEVLFDPLAPTRGCPFMNQTLGHAVQVATGGCPPVSDPHTPFNLGESYGPYLIDRFTTGEPGRSATIRFLMSTWNPYEVVLMQTVLRSGPR